MIQFSDTTRKALASVAVSFLMLACGGGSSGGGESPDGSSPPPTGACADFAGAYDVTSEIVTTTCPVGLHVITQPITYTFTQAAPSCSFTMTNSLYPSSQYSGDFTMEGSQAKVTWTSVSPAPISAGYALTYTSESLTITAPNTLSGSFAWSNAYGCTGTTNICAGSLSSGCATPN